MSKTVRHGKPTELVAGSHDKRITALERNAQTARARRWAQGGAGLREALFSLIGDTPTIQAQNFELVAASGDINIPQSDVTMTNGRRAYMAIYWPGGPMSGMAYIQSVTGAFTDSGSGLQLLGANSGGNPVTGSSTVLVPITGAQGSTAGLWKQATAGIAQAVFPSALTLAAGIYYAEFFSNWSASTTVPHIAGVRVVTGDPAWDTTFVPTASPGQTYPIFGVMDSQTTLGTGNISLATSGGNLSRATNMFWVGLY